ncbi:het domain-containing protein [Colletotrichum musicola]|uniref:Het domain-containing protein n=1 Tax=Colletotrichum musicola TaxID=2175873 RepID=A0A8H6U6T8_9PEZI|nr:het domain-containing protein [Colletotrichum musicola]
MRLLNVKSRKLEEYFNNPPTYAILSHCWGDDEVLFQDLDDSGYTSKMGYAKVDGFCTLAASHGYDYVWIDTCCIDKTSSAELSEAINSMFRWYKGAAVCYAYLEDVQHGPVSYVPDLDFENSRWFTRGWTLQELLAPKHVDFYNRAWSHIGDRSSLADTIKNITRIPAPYLRNEQDFHSASIAVRMSWAAFRKTKRIEDRAYSLLGMFGVNMPLLYGEGDRAFERLQLTLIDETTDESILAWSPSTNTLDSTSSQDSMWFSTFWASQYQLPPPCYPGMEHEADSSQIYARSSSHGLLARVPEDFACWKDAVVTPLYEANSVMEMSNKGLRITLPLVELEDHTYGFLRCKVGRNFDQAILLPLSQTSVADEYARSHRPFLLKPRNFSKYISKRINVNTIYIKKKSDKEPSVEYPIWNTGLKCGHVRLQESADLPERLVEVIPSQAYNRRLHVLYPLNDGHNNWNRTLLHYSAGDGDLGFVIILEKRSHMDAFLSPNKVSPPFKCHIVPKSDQSLSVQAQDLKKYVDFQAPRTRLLWKDGERVAQVKHDTFLNHEMFTIDVSNDFGSAKQFWIFHRDDMIRSSIADIVSFCGRYVLDSLRISWQEFFYVPISIISWRYSRLLHVGEIVAWGAVTALFFMARLKAYWAACSVHVSGLSSRETDIRARMKYLDRFFISFHLVMNIVPFCRGLISGSSWAGVGQL